MALSLDTLYRKKDEWQAKLNKNPKDRMAKHLVEAYEDEIQREIKRVEGKKVHGMNSIESLMIKK